MNLGVFITQFYSPELKTYRYVSGLIPEKKLFVVVFVLLYSMVVAFIYVNMTMMKKFYVF